MKTKLVKPERREKLEALIKLAGDGAIDQDQVAKFCMLADEELLYLWRMFDAGEHSCRYEFDGHKPCKRCQAESDYYEKRGKPWDVR